MRDASTSMEHLSNSLHIDVIFSSQEQFCNVIEALRKLISPPRPDNDLDCHQNLNT